MNPLYQQMLMNNTPANNVVMLFDRFNQFKSNFKGNAQEQIMNMLRTGQISQQQYDSAVLQAQQLQKVFIFNGTNGQCTGR